LPAEGFAEQFAQAFAPEPETAHGKPTGDSAAATTGAAGGGVLDPSLFDQPARADGVRSGDAAPADAAQPAADPLTEDRFAAVNHARIAREVRGELMPNGGSMHLRLDPPELGALQVSVHLKDGVVTAAFQAQNEDAARLLSHTMGDLRASLEAQGVMVDKLHVQHAPRDEAGGNGTGRDGTGRPNPSFEQQQDARREQQRKDMVQRLWDKLNGVAPLDLVA
jgi:flagellar hook-length control protein FliK